MKILFFGKTKRRTQSTQYIANAFRRKGHSLKWMKPHRCERIIGARLTHRLLIAVFERFRPDLVFSWSHDIPLGFLEAIAAKIKTAIFYPDIALAERHLQKDKLVDYFFLTNRSQLEEYRRLGVRNPTFILQACDRDEHRRVPPRKGKWESDVAFVGRPREEGGRLDFLKSVAARYTLKIWGYGNVEISGLNGCKKDVKPEEYAIICSSSKIMLGCDHARGLRCYFSNRTWITLGCGGFLLTSYQPGLEEVFENRKHLVWYRSPEECLELIEYYLKHDDERRSIADNGCRLAHESHTYDHFVDEVLQTVFENPVSI